MAAVRPPDRQDFNTYRQRNLASQRSTAYDTTNRVFNALLPFFGKKALMPLVYFGTGNLGPEGHGFSLEKMPEGVSAAYPKGRYGGPAGTVGMSKERFINLLFGHDRGDYQIDKDNFQRGIDALVHELAHTQQRQSRIGNKVEMEGGADSFAEAVRNHIVQALGLDRPHLPYQGYPQHYDNQFRQRHNQNYVLYGQFR